MLGDTIRIEFQLKNEGLVHGTEVLQCYLKSLVTNETRPVQELVQFQRISLAPKEVTQSAFILALNQELSTFGLSSGDYEIQIGSSSKDIKIVVPFTLE